VPTLALLLLGGAAGCSSQQAGHSSGGTSGSSGGTSGSSAGTSGSSAGTSGSSGGRGGSAGDNSGSAAGGASAGSTGGVKSGLGGGPGGSAGTVAAGGAKGTGAGGTGIGGRNGVGGSDASVPEAGTKDAETSPDAAGALASSFICGNWADPRDNFVPDNLVPSGLSATDTYDSLRAKSDAILGDFQSLIGANSVRIPINEPTVAGPWWQMYKGAIDAATARGMKVLVSYWAYPNKGLIPNRGKFNVMWQQVVSDYIGNELVYFQIFNEPWGYSPAASIQIAVDWLTMFPQVPRGRIIVAGSYSDNDVTMPGADPRLDDTLLSLHIYGFNDATLSTVQGWRDKLQSNLGAFTARTIVTEWGGTMTSGINYSLPNDGNHDGAYLTAMSGYIHDNHMGSCYWPLLRNGDSWSLTTLSGTGTQLKLTPTNASGLARVRYASGM
jgi:endoglucanase